MPRCSTPAVIVVANEESKDDFSGLGIPEQEHSQGLDNSSAGVILKQ